MPNPGDYFTTYIGRQPVVIDPRRGGELHCLINACSHRGANVGSADAKRTTARL